MLQKFYLNEIEEKILGGPGSEGLSSLMEFYQNEWTVIVEDDNGEEMEMLLYNAMQDNNIKEFKVNWKLEELDSNWNENEVNLIDEDDGFDLEDGGIEKGFNEIYDYTNFRYHGVKDEYDPSWNLEGFEQTINTIFNISLDLSNSSDWPNWYEGNEFRAIRNLSLEIKDN